MTSLLCETVTAPTTAELVAARDASVADMVELRLDDVGDLDVAGVLAGRRVPVVVTCRPGWEGGRFRGSEDERRTILERALELGAEYVDVEWRAAAESGSGFDTLVTHGGRRVLLSSHDFDGVPADLTPRARAMRGTGAGAIKLAVAARRLSDTLPLRDIAREGGAVVVGMGDAGVPSRLLATTYGSLWTYGGHGVAPGQMPAARMIDEFRFRTIGPSTRIYGVVSTNAMHSVSPAMHNAAFAAAGLDAVYVPLATSSFDDFLTYAAAVGIEGVSVTIPFKIDALNAAVEATERAQVVGAANTLKRSAQLPNGRTALSAGTAWRRSSSWEAANTDIEGFLTPLDAAYGPTLPGARAAILGAGGSARAVIAALRARQVRVTVHARRPEQAFEAGERLGAEVGPWPVPPGSWDLLINCTPLGGAALRQESPLPGGPFTGRMVYDLTYGPGESRLLREARAAGCLTLDGLPMLVAQAERQFEWWTGQRPVPGVMRDAARNKVC